MLVRVRTLLPEFTGALQRVAEQVLTDPAAASRATIVELAERSGTSPATVTRFCRALGFDGYADLRLGIAAETGRARSAGWTVDIGREIQPSDPLERVLGQIMAADTRAMHDTAALLDLAEVERAAVAIAAAPRVNIFGASGSALVGEEMQFSLHRIGVAAWAWTDVHNGLASAALSRRRRRRARHLAQRRDRRDHRAARRGQQPRRHHDRADQLPPLAAGRARRHRPAHRHPGDDLPAGRALRAAPAAGRPRSALRRRRPADPRTFARGLPAHRPSGPRPQGRQGRRL